MNPTVKTLGIFALGFAAGAGVSFVALRHWFQKKFDEELEEERETLRNRVAKMAGNGPKTASKGPTSDSEPPANHLIVPTKDPLVESVRASQEASNKVAYHKEVARYDGSYEEQLKQDEEDELSGEELYWKQQREAREKALKEEGPISLIDEDIFVDDEMDYDQVYLTWYTVDNTLVDLSGNIVQIEDVLGVGGEFWLDAHKEVLYLKNNENSTIIEVVVTNDRYSERVGDYEDDEDGIKRRKRR